LEISQHLIDRAFNRDEIRSAAGRAHITRAFLASKLNGKEEAMLEAAEKEIDVYESLKAADEQAKGAIEKAKEDEKEKITAPYRPRAEELERALQQLGPKPDSARAAEPAWAYYLELVLVTVTALSTVLVGLFALLGFYFGWSNIIGWFTLRAITFLCVFYVGCLASTLSVSVYKRFSRRRYEERRAEIQRELSELQSELGLELKEIDAQYEMEANPEVEAAKEAAEEAIIENGILPQLRIEIEDIQGPNYDSTLTVPVAPGLAEVPNPKYEITTVSRGKLERLLKTMPGGSIGIAGPRGAGKSTLLRALCEKSQKLTRARDELAVMTSAPVVYEPREFILHVFSLVCQKALTLENETPNQPSQSMTSGQRSNEPVVGALLPRLIGLKEAMRLLTLGWVLFLISLLLVYVSAHVPTPPDLAKADSFLEIARLYTSALGVKPAPVFYLGLLCVVLGILGWTASRREYRGTRAELDESSPDQMESEYSRTRDPDVGLVAQAKSNLDEIRWQQSYSSGWGGSLKITPIAPVVAEAKEETGIAFARKQLSLPEIVKEYEDFLALAHTKYKKIIVGIDELDKLQDDEQAQRFMNEIKALFGLEHCFYLLSVSENAMSSFSRRGVPFRDVFDSSFDDIVYVNYLDAEAARELLRRRVIGIPVPFLDFCYCMSGGLPRDLIRACRTLFELKETTQCENTLAALCDTMVKRDLLAQLRATSVAARNTASGSDVDKLFEIMRRLEEMVSADRSLVHIRSKLLTVCGELFSDITESSDLTTGRLSIKAITDRLQTFLQPTSDQALEQSEKLASLRVELGVYVYYSITLLQLFTRSRGTSAKEYVSDRNPDVVDRLARVRQLLAENPHIARSELADIRKGYGWQIA
jgi:hypothetical protein